MTEDDLQKIYESYETTDLLAVLNNGPDEIRDDLYKLHQLAMEVANHSDDTNAEEMFELADELEMKVSDAIERMEQLLDQLQKLTALDPANCAEQD